MHANDKIMNNEFLQTEEAIVAMLKTVYDPEIPVNVYDLGLIYKVEVDEHKQVQIEMTLTAPNCPAADFILEDVRMKVESVPDVKSVDIRLVFEPEWDKEMMSEEAKLELGFL
ncbi:FeS assembly SUF system protein [Parabacteroides sp. PM5-20]|nr:FeS assembly SUF system protein [Parabacteroides sp. PM5-20]